MTYCEKDKLISIRVNAQKYEMVKSYLDKNRYKTIPATSFGTILDEALDSFIRDKNISVKPKTIKGQTKIHFDNVEMYIQDN